MRNLHFYVPVFTIFAAIAAACGGGGSGGNNNGPLPTSPPSSNTPGPTPTPGSTPSPHMTATPNPTPTPGITPTPSSKAASATYTLASSGGTYQIPNCGGISGTATFPASNALPNTSFTITNYCPNSTPTILGQTVLPGFFRLVSGTPVAFIEIAAFNSQVTFNAFGGSVTLNLAPGSVPSGQLLYLGACDESSCNHEPTFASITSVFGPLQYNGGAISLNTQSFESEFPVYVRKAPRSLSPPLNGRYLSFVYASPLASIIQARYTRGFDGRAPAVDFITLHR